MALDLIRKTLLLLLLAGFSISLHAQLSADFTADVTAGCAPLKISFSNRTLGASSGATYQWDLGNGNSSVLANPAAVYNETKTYNITLTVTDNGRTSSKTRTVTVHPPPVADFTIATPKVCLPSPVSFTSTSQPGGGNITSYYWDFGDGAAQQGYGPSMSHTYSFEQESPVSLTVTNNFGCSHTVVKNDAVKILPAIGAGFTASQEVLCKETDPVSFSNSSFGPGTLSYEWDFGDGSKSTEKSPSYAFDKKGIYTVKLSVKSSEGCTAEQVRSNYLNVAQYSSDFTVPALICTGTTASFTASPSPSPASTSWEINGNPTYGYYYGRLDYSFQTEGTYTVKMNHTFGTCPLSVTKTVQVKKSPRADGFTSNVVGLCGAPTDVVFEDPGTDVVKWEWIFNYNYYDQTIDATGKKPTWNYPTNGYKNIFLKVTTADGCTASASKQLFLNPPQISVEFKDLVSETNALTTCEKPIELTFFSQNASQIAAYSWQFSDGTTSTEAEPRKKFTAVGNHWGSLSYTTKNGCKGNVTLGSIKIYGTPVANFTASTLETCGPNPILFTATGSQHAEYWDWNFGDHSGHYQSSVQKSYAAEGTYDVTLKVSNARCQSSITKTQYVKVNAPFAVISSKQNTCLNNRGDVSFTHGSSTATEVIWDFGDNTTPVKKPATETDIIHKYTKNGNYTATLTAINGACSLKTSTSVPVLLKQKPTLSPVQSEICIGGSVQVTASNLEDNPAIDYYYGGEYNIRFVNDDYTPFTGSSYTNDYYWKLEYKGFLSNFTEDPSKIKAIITSYYFGCEDTTAAITVRMKGASASFSVLEDNKCWDGSEVVFRDESVHFGNNAIISRTWNFGDGNSYTTDKQETVKHSYTNPGNYNVTLQVKDAAGCTHSTNAYANYARVNGPKAQFNLSTGNTVNQNALVYFYNNTQHYGSYDVVYKWFVNDVRIPDDYYPQYRFVAPGNYTIRLEASSAETGCSSSFSQELLVKPFNYAFSFNTTLIGGRNCPPALVRFQNTSVNYTRVEWDFGDGFKLGNTNYPSHIYEKPGKYYVKLFVYGPNGLTGAFKDSVVLGQPIAAISANSFEGCKGHTVTLTSASENSTRYIWDYGDGLTANGSASNSDHSYPVPGSYLPSVTAIDANGCMHSVPLNAPVIIRKDPTILLSAPKTRLCLGESVTISANGAATYEWTASNALNTANGPTVIATPTLNQAFSVKGMDDIGCAGNASIPIDVVQPQQISVSPDVAICMGEETKLSASGTDQIRWINELIGLDDPQSKTPVVKPGQSTVYTVQGSDQYNCFKTEASVRVTVNALPTVSAGDDVEVLAGTSFQINPTSSSDVISWNWSPQIFLSCAGCPNPVVKPLSEMQYVVTATNGAGCKAIDTIAVKLQCESNLVHVPNGFTPNGDGHNDRLLVKGIGIIKRMVVYSRWGDKVFEQSNFIASEPTNAWNGYIRGLPAPAGTYVYFIEMQCPGGQPFTKKGTVTLMR
ncbi:MAG: PKD domain-containing protein [Chitinophagaceae bacterium]